jgi:hypothetical protein
MCLSGALLVAAERAAEEQFEPQHRRKVRRHHRAQQLLGVAASAQHLTLAEERADVTENGGRALAPVAVLRKRGRQLVHVALHVEHPHQGRRRRIWKGAEKEGVHHAEERGRGADTQRQGERDDDAERRRPANRPQRMVEVLASGGHESFLRM